MCGFAGVIAWDDRYRVSHETLKKMSDAIAHRGPDGEGFHINHQENITPENPQVALAFRRLAILDPDPRSNQPFTDGRHWLVFNGEIYNFRELKKELSTLDEKYQWRTTGDTEVLLRAYAVWGEKCVEHLNGMFALAVWDGVERSLFLARDRMGQKPLYIAERSDTSAPNVIAFASELSALTKLDWIDLQINSDALGQYLLQGYVSGNSIFAGARQLRPGVSSRIESLKNRRMIEAPFFHIKSEAVDRNPHRVVTETRQLLSESVIKQLVSDVPLGCFLSGGIDSSVVAAAIRASGAQVDTFSIGFDDPRYDERDSARRVAAHLGTRHHEFCVQPDAAQDLPRLAEIFSEPFADSSAIPTHYLSRFARQHVKVALSGDGGDELFGGYDRYRAMHIASRLDYLPRSIRRVISTTIETLPHGHPKSRLSRLRRFGSEVSKLPVTRYSGFRSTLFNLSLLHELLPRSFYHGSQNSLDEDLFLLANLLANDPVRGALQYDRLTYLPNDLLTKVDRCSMLHGLEVRSPFMDHELVQFAAGLTTDQLLKGGSKRMLREAFKDDLPAWVFKRKKMGFAVPIGDWFRGELRSMLRDTLFSSHAFGRSHFDMKVVERLVEEHETKRVDHSQRLYALLMLELWWNTVR